jgi:hypothetical protein
MTTADASVLFFSDRSIDSECFRTLNYEHDTRNVMLLRRAVPHGLTCVHRKSVQQQLLALLINESLGYNNLGHGFPNCGMRTTSGTPALFNGTIETFAGNFLCLIIETLM